MNKTSKQRKTASKITPNRSMLETPTATDVSTYVPTMFTNPDFFAQGD
jgi:hypothetical protein